MLPEAIQLVVVTPERQLLRETVVEVDIPGGEGQLGILPGHAPLMTEVGIGALSYRSSASSQPVTLAVIQGFAEVLPDRVTVLAETAERAEEIDVERAQRAKQRAEDRLKNVTATDIDFERARAALMRSLARLQAAGHMKGEPLA